MQDDFVLYSDTAKNNPPQQVGVIESRRKEEGWFLDGRRQMFGPIPPDLSEERQREEIESMLKEQIASGVMQLTSGEVDTKLALFKQDYSPSDVYSWL